MSKEQLITLRELQNASPDKSKLFILRDKDDNDTFSSSGFSTGDIVMCVGDPDRASIGVTLLRVVSTSETMAYVEFITAATVKWDLCSHFYFTGEDTLLENGDWDSYYHICGDYSYLTMILSYLMVLDVAPKFFPNFNCGDKLNSVIKEFQTIYKKYYDLKEVDYEKYIKNIEEYIM